MDRIHNAVACYQSKIGTYDKQLWEQSVEQKVLKGIQHAPRKSGRVKTELIDVDLVRGSTFSKAKPQVPWTAITQRAVLRVIFFPLYYKWWVQQTSWKFWCFLLFLYSLQVAAATVYMLNMGDYLTQENVTLTEVLVPFVLMVVLALVHSQTVLTHWSHKSLVRDNKSKRDASRAKNRKSSSRDGSVLSDQASVDKGNSGQSDDRSVKSEPGKHKRKQTQGSGVNRRSSCQGKVRSKPTASRSKSPTWDHDVKFQDSGHHDNGSNPGSTTTTYSDVPEDHSSFPFNCSSTPTNSSSLESSKAALQRDSLGQLSSGPSAQTWKDKESEAKNSFCLNCCETAAKIELGNKPRPLCLAQSVDECELQQKVLPCLIHGPVRRKGSGYERTSRTNGTSGEDSSGSLGKFEILPSVTNDFCREGVNDRPALEKDSAFLSEEPLTQVDGSEKEKERLETSFSKDGEDETTSNEDVSETTSTAEREVRRKRYNARFLKKAESRSKDLKSHQSACRNCSRVQDMCNSSPKGCELKNTDLHTLENSTTREATQCFSVNPSGWGPVDDSDEYLQIRRSYSSTHTNCRRRKTGGADCSHDMPSYGQRTRRVPTSLGVRMHDLKESTGLSSSDGETSPASPLFSKGALSSEEWEFRIQSDVATSTSSASSCASDREMSGEDGEVDSADAGGVMGGTMGAGLSATSSSAMHVINLLQPPPNASLSHPHTSPQPDKVSCVIWEGNECKKVDLTALDIGWAIIEKVDAIPESSDYILIGLAFSLLLGLVPLAFRAYLSKTSLALMSVHGAVAVVYSVVESPWQLNLIAVNGVIQRVCLSMIFFFLLSVADRTFKQRLLYAKHFCYLTSSRRAKKYDMPHFRLNKVRNIKMWLSLRSYLKKRGPQRSVDVIVSSAFMLSITHLAMMCIQLLKDTDKFLESLVNWELCVWCMALGVYLLRFMTLGLKINKKYRNLSVLITEQINLYLQMEQKPHKKEELMLANNVLKLAEDLLKELESPFKISGMSANPFVYNATKVVLLSAFSAVLTELLGFKLKLYKIKIP